MEVFQGDINLYIKIVRTDGKNARESNTQSPINCRKINDIRFNVVRSLTATYIHTSNY